MSVSKNRLTWDKNEQKIRGVWAESTVGFGSGSEKVEFMERQASVQ